MPKQDAKDIVSKLSKLKCDFSSLEDGDLEGLKTDDIERARRNNGLKPKKKLPEDTEHPEPMITEESLKIVREKEEAENKLKALEKQQTDTIDDKRTAKEIIEVVILRCPHCGGKLKMKE